MSLSDDMIKQFVRMMHSTDNIKQETTAYGTVTKNQNDLYVVLDGSDVMTPVETTFELKDEDRVIVSIRDHHAIVIGNLTNPATGVNDENISNMISSEVSKLERYIDGEIEDLNNELIELNTVTKTSLENNINQVNDTLKTSIRNTHTELEDRINGFSGEIKSDYIINTIPTDETVDAEIYNDDIIDIIKNTTVVKYKTQQDDTNRVGISLDDAPLDIIYNDGVDLFSMISLLWAAVQQQQVIIDNLLNNTEEGEEGSE